ncbi:hypothetical protein BVG80_15665, partial [Sphingobacteriales bacterium TSM_CSM]
MSATNVQSPTFTTTATVPSYGVIITDFNECKASANSGAITVVADPAAPTATQSPSATTVCAGTTLTLTGVSTPSGGAGTCAVEFSSNGGASWTSTVPSISAVPGSNTIRIRTNCSASGCTSTETVYTWTGIANPSGGSFAAVTFCEALSGVATVTGVSNVTEYLWSLPTGITASSTLTTANNTTLSSNSPGTYTVTVTPRNVSGGITCSGTPLTATVTVKSRSNAPTSISTSANPICVGSSTTLTPVGGFLGTGAVYNWYENGYPGGTFIQNSTAGSPSITVSPTTTTTYYVVANGDCNTTTAASVTVTVNTFSTAPTGISGTTTICNGGNTTLSVVGGLLGSGANWQWYSGSCGGTPVGTGTSVTVFPTATTTYFVRAEGPCNTTTCASVTVTVNTLSTDPTGVTGSTTICNGSSTTLTVSGGFMGSGAVAEWFTGFCGGASVGTGNSVTVSPTVNTIYYVRYSGTCNTTGCYSFLVTVNPTPTVTATNNAPNICSGGSTDISLSAAAANVPGTTFNWSWVNPNVSGTTAQNGVSGPIAVALTNLVNTPQTVTFNITPVANGCFGTTINVSVVVNPIPSVTITNSTPNFCSGGTTGISLSPAPNGVSGTTYNWTRTNTLSVTGLNSQTGISGPIAISLTNTSTINQTTVFTVTPVANGCLGAPQTTSVIVYPLPDATYSVTPSTPICEGLSTTITISPSQSGVNYQLRRSNNSLVSGAVVSGTGGAVIINVPAAELTAAGSPVTFNILATNTTTSCSVQLANTATIVVNSAPVAPTGATANGQSPLNLCADYTGNITLQAVGGSLGSDGYIQWYENGCGSGLLGSGNSLEIPAPLADATYYVIYFSPSCGPTVCAAVSVTVSPLPDASLTVTATSPVCEGSTSALQIINSESGVTYQLRRSDNSNISGATVTGNGGTVSITIPAAELTFAGSPYTFNILATTPNNCSAVLSNTATVVVNPTPTATAPSNQTYCAGIATSAISLSGTPSGVTFNISGGAAIGLANQTGVTAVPSFTPIAGSATISITPVANGCAGSPVTYNITVHPTPTATAPSDQSYCAGITTSAISLSGTPSGVTFNISGGAGIGLANQTGVTAIPAFTPTEGSATISITPVANGCTGSPVTYNILVKSLINYANLQFPATGTICQSSTFTIYGQVYEPGVTEAGGAGAGIVAEFGYHTANTDPSTWTNWSAATFNTQVGNNDEYRGTFSGLAPGTYYYTFRYSLNGCPYQYGGFSGGFWNGTSNVSGVLTVNPNHTLTLTSAGATTNQTVCQNSAITNITYTVGGGATSASASGLPTGVTGNFNAGTFTISGTPTVSGGTFNYTVTTSGNSCTVATATGTIIVNSLLDYVNLQFPSSGTICAGGSVAIFGQVYEPGVTPGAGTQGAGITAELGYSTTNTNPNTWTNWQTATFNPGGGGANNDEYQSNLGASLAPGIYYYTYRYSFNGCPYQYGGFNVGGGDGFWDGTNDISGTLTVLADPTAPTNTPAPAAGTVCVGAVLSITASGSTGGFGTCVYEYAIDPGTGIFGTFGATNTVTVSSVGNGTYRIKSRYNCNGTGCDISAETMTTWTVVADPTINTQPLTTQSVCVGATPTDLTIAATGGTPSLTYQWYSNTVNNNTTGTLISGATNASYTPSTATPGTLYYYCIVSASGNACNSVTSNTGAVIVYGTTITSGAVGGLATLNLCEGGNPASFTVGAPSGGSGTYTYSWEQSDGCTGTWVPAAGSTNSLSYDPPAVSLPTTSICYRLVITDACGSVAYSATKTYNVYPDAISPTINPAPANGTTICVGSSVSATFNPGSGGIPGSITDTYEYSTNSGGSWLPYTSGTPIVATAGMVGTNTIRIRTQRTLTGSGCNDGAVNTVQFSVIANPGGGSIASVAFCTGSSATATVTGVSDATQYVWNLPAQLSGSSTTNSITLSGTTEGSYTITVTPQNVSGGTTCSGTPITGLVTVSPTPSVGNQTTSVCSGVTFTVSPAGVPVGTTYSWSAPSGSGFTGGTSGSNATSISGNLINTTTGAVTATYTVTPTSGTCVGTAFTVTVTVNPTPVAAIAITEASGIPNDGIVCPGSDIKLTASEGDTYVWTLPNASTSTSNPLNITGATLADAGTYTVTVTSAQGCTNSTSVVITVLDNTAPVISDCPANITVYSNSGNPLTCSQTASWTEPTALDNCAGAITYTSRSHAPGATFPLGTTTVTYVYSDASANSSTCSFTVTVVDNTPPVALCPSNITQPAASGQCSAAVTFTLPAPTDNCSATSVANPVSGSTFNVGTTTVTV